MQKISKKVKLISLIILIVLAATIIFLVINKNPEEIDRMENKNNIEKTNEELFIVAGEFVCLPVKDENVPHNDLCAFGIKNDKDEYYRLQSMNDDKFNVIASLSVGQKIEISGLFINEDSDIYKTLGTIEVDSVRVLELSDDSVNSNLPNSFTANFISFSNYSLEIFKAMEYPKLESWVNNGEIGCEVTPLESSLPLRMSKKEINGRQYCIGAFSEGAAGSVYTEYAYATVVGEDVYVIKFVARYPNCSNYPDKERGECEMERETFNLDNLVDLEVR